ncbi:MAG: hypothetical protein QGH39_04555 [Candidatus Thermoplasmatota archaeon]|jgi:DICT domain-containing protein|nr:hypothetical protein [Candidatus Thermoplasmatota archaeon]MDP7264815.1 hypothetical protein [Candidatus Thermoplasmatota archaeon]
MEHKLDPEVKDALIDNPLVQTAFRDEKKEGEFMMRTCISLSRHRQYTGP